MVHGKEIPKQIKILFLTLNSGLQGPLPKHNPLLIAAFENLGCRVTRRTWGRHSENENLFEKIFGRLEDIGKALVELDRMKPDIMYVATTLDEPALVRDILLLLATCWSPVKKVLKMHGSKTDPLIEPGHSFYKLLTRILIRFSDAVLLLSTDEIQKWTSFDPKGRFYQVDNPFLPARGLKPDSQTNKLITTDTRPIILFVGRLIKEKGIFELLRAMEIILNEIDCRLLIVGDGKEKFELTRRIESRNLVSSVSLLGYLDSNELDEIYRNSTIFILPSYREGFPTTIIEAMNYGLPIVTTPVGGIPDHLLEGINALFIRPKDPDMIANAVIRLIKDPKLCEEMGSANNVKVQEFRPEKVAPKYVEIFSAIIQGK